jgi:dephospho-CoA kinase
LTGRLFIVGRVESQAWWVAGSPCSGKSTLAGWVAGVAGAHLYSCDDAFDRHAATVADERGPALKKVTSMSVQERLAQPIEVQVADVFQLYREEWALILADLGAVPGPVVIEGAALLPELLAGLGVAPDRAVWVVPTEAFQRERYAHRPWAQDLLRHTSDPAAAFERWMQRDAIFATTVVRQARELGYQVLVTDGRTPVREVQDTLINMLATPRR